MDTLKTFYRNSLPHLTPIGGTFFVTFRTKGSIPNRKLNRFRFQYLEEVKNISSNGSLQSRALLQARRRFFKRFDQALHLNNDNRSPLSNPAATKIIQAKLHELDGELYELIAYCVMPNHVHLLISMRNQIINDEMDLIPNKDLSLSYRPLHEVMRRIKGATARSINLLMGSTGTTLWQKDSYDHYVNNSRSLENTWWYILNNPVKAGLVENIEDYPYTWWRGRE